VHEITIDSCLRSAEPLYLARLAQHNGSMSIEHSIGDCIESGIEGAKPIAGVARGAAALAARRAGELRSN
jgi:hypothetical protein